MMKCQSALCCLQKKLNFGGAVTTPTNYSIGNPPRDLFTAHETSGE